MANLTFIEFLTELQVSDEPMQALKDVKQAARSPDRYKRQQMAKNIDAQQDIQKAADDPLKSDKLRVAKMRQRLAMQQKKLAQKEQRAEKQAGVETDRQQGAY